MRLQSIVNTSESIQISYLEEADIDPQSGIMEARTVDIPHAVVPQDQVDELVDVARQILETARVARRRPAESFVAQR